MKGVTEDSLVDIETPTDGGLHVFSRLPHDQTIGYLNRTFLKLRGMNAEYTVYESATRQPIRAQREGRTITKPEKLATLLAS